MLNVLKPEKGWESIEAVWRRMQTNDYLIISGLDNAQFNSSSYKLVHEVDGIVEVHLQGGGFYKSALMPHFTDFLVNRLDQASVLLEEHFKFKIKSNSIKTIEVKGRRLLAIRKH